MRQMIARGFLAVALLACVVVYVQPVQMLQAARSLNPGWVLAAILLGVSGLVIQWWKWAQLSVLLPRPLTRGQLTHSLFGGFALGMISPGRVGEFGRALFVESQHRQVSVLTAFDRSVSALLTLLLGGIALFIWLPASRWPLLALSMAGPGLCWILRGRLGKVARRFDIGSRLGLSTWSVGALRPGLRNVLGSLLFNFVFLAQFYCLLRAGSTIVESALIGIPLVFAAKTLLPFAPMDLGVRETAAVVVMGHFGVASAVALQASLLLFAINVLAPGLVGLIVVGTGRWQGISFSFSFPSRYPTS